MPRLARGGAARALGSGGCLETTRPKATVANCIDNAGSMEKIWLKSYPPGVPAEIEATARSIGDLLETSVAAFGPLAAFENMGQRLTFHDVDRLSRDLAAWLQSRGLARGERVALMAPNLLQYPIALFAVLRAGLVVVNCNPLYSPRELESQLCDSGARALIVLENFAHVAEQVLARTNVEHVITTQIGDLLAFPKRVIVNTTVKRIKKMVPAWSIKGAVDFRSALREGAKTSFQDAEVDNDDLAFLQYTGGTTGTPKGAMLTHGNIVANLEQCHAWLKPAMNTAGLTAITALPLYHIFALTANCLMFFKIGARNVLITNPRDIPALVGELRRAGPFALITGVNTLFNALLNNPGFAALDFSGLRLVLGGGMAIQRSVAERWQATTGRPLIEAYGLTETSPGVTINPLDATEWTGSIGLPIPSTEIVIRDEEGHDLAVGQAGELCVRGPQVMKGYWRQPAETAAAFTPDGFLRTGDIALIDTAGFVRIVDRKKDMIIVSGFNVYPNEVEEVVCMHDGVLEAAVVAAPDPVSGEAVRLVVVRRDPDLDAAALIAHCRKHLTGYKIPRLIEFRDELPKSNVGKILRRELRRERVDPAGPLVQGPAP